VLNTFPKEKSVVNRELSNRAYDTFSYFVAKLVTELPLNCVPPMMFSTIIYWIVGLNPAPDRILQFYGIISMLALSACALGLVVSAVAPNVDAANSLGPPVMIIFLLFGGFYINVQSLPVGANYMPYISFMYWGFKALAINEYAGETFDCDGSAGCLSTGDQVKNKQTDKQTNADKRNLSLPFCSTT
jgi:ABC-type multidrug transport system permease subunit